MSLLALPTPLSAPDISPRQGGKSIQNQKLQSLRKIEKDFHPRQHSAQLWHEEESVLPAISTASPPWDHGWRSQWASLHCGWPPGTSVPCNARASSCCWRLSVWGRHLVPTGAKTHQLPPGHGMGYRGGLHFLPLCQTQGSGPFKPSVAFANSMWQRYEWAGQGLQKCRSYFLSAQQP